MWAKILLLGLFFAASLGAAPDSVRAFHRSGQTFLTWKEDPGTRSESYRIYSFVTKPTLEDWSRAEPIAQVGEGSAIFPEMHRKPGKLMDWEGSISFDGPVSSPVIPRYVIRTGEAPLRQGIGLHVYTIPESSNTWTTAYYIVTQVTESVEEKPDIHRQISPPVVEKAAPPQPVRYYSDAMAKRDWFILWLDWEKFRNSYIGAAVPFSIASGKVQFGADMPELVLGGIGTTATQPPPDGPFSIGDLHQPPTNYYGFHDNPSYDGSYRKGRDLRDSISNFVQYRIVQALLWYQKEFDLDMTRFHVRGFSMGGSGTLALGLAFPSLVGSLFMEQGLVDYDAVARKKKWNVANYGHVKWNNPVRNLPFEQPDLNWYLQFNGEPVWSYKDAITFLKNSPSTSFPMIAAGHTFSDKAIPWETQGKPFEAYLRDSRRCFSYHAAPGRHEWGIVRPGLMYGKVRVDESRPGFSAVPPRPVHRDRDFRRPKPEERGYLLDAGWGTRDHPFRGRAIAESDTSWSLPLFSLPLENVPDEKALEVRDGYKVDITPRNLQSLRFEKGALFSYTILTLEGKPIRQGQAEADGQQLVLIKDVPLRPSGILLELRKLESGKEELAFHLP